MCFSPAVLPKPFANFPDFFADLKVRINAQRAFPTRTQRLMLICHLRFRMGFA